MVNKIQEGGNKLLNGYLQKTLKEVQALGIQTDVLSFAFTDIRNKTYMHGTTAITWGLYNLDNNIINMPNVIKMTVKEGFITNCNSPFEDEARKVLTRDNVDINNHAVVLTCAQDNGYTTLVFNCKPNTITEHTKTIMKYIAVKLSYDVKQLMHEYYNIKQLEVPIESHNIEQLLANHRADISKNDTLPTVTGINDMPSISVCNIDIDGNILYYIRTVIENWSNVKSDQQGLSAPRRSGMRNKIKKLGFKDDTEFIKFLINNHILDCIPKIQTL